MSGGPRFPKHPLAGRDQGFHDADGKNRFADAGSPRPPAENPTDDNIFAAPQDVGQRPVEATFYEPVLPHRGRYVFLLGLISMVGSVFAALIVGPILWLLIAGAAQMVLVVTAATIGISTMAIVVARADLRAIAAGAMDPSGRHHLELGKRFAWIGLSVGVLSFTGMAIWIVNGILSAL